MCGRYTSTSTVDELAAAYRVDDVRADPLPLRYNVAPSQPVYAVAARRPVVAGDAVLRLLGTFRWGLVPAWARDPAVGNRMINARAEGIATKPAFRGALARRRCIIPADAFYEWQVRSDGPGARPGRPAKLPWAVRLRPPARPMAFAGLWEVWRNRDDPDAEPLRTCTIITTEANPRLSPIHTRMPVVLPEGAWDIWLDPRIEDTAVVEGLLVAAPGDWFDAYPVSTLVSNVANEGPELLEPAPPPADPLLPPADPALPPADPELPLG